MKNLKKDLLIDIARCKGCELCVFYCPQKCLKLSAKFNSAGHHPVELFKPEKCTFCGICYIMCPDYVITIKD